MIIRNGMVALQHYNSNGCTVIMQEDKKTYVFVPKHNISMSWVEEKHTPALLNQLARMCCGKKQKKFFPASQINVNLWETGNRHGNLNE